jgi:large-conductance mechanosensitive channel
MNWNIGIPVSIVAIAIFIYFKNVQANRQQRRKERLQQKQDELIELLQKKNEEQL